MSWSDAERERQARKRAAYVAQGLTAKGKPRKGRHKPAPHQAMTFVKAKSTSPDQPKSTPKTPLNVLRHPPKLPAIRPLTDRDRQAA